MYVENEYVTGQPNAKQSIPYRARINVNPIQYDLLDSAPNNIVAVHCFKCASREVASRS